MKIFVYENFVCKLGETAKENWNLLDKAENNYLFFIYHRSLLVM